VVYLFDDEPAVARMDDGASRYLGEAGSEALRIFVVSQHWTHIQLEQLPE
jgi:hypothetical protein